MRQLGVIFLFLSFSVFAQNPKIDFYVAGKNITPQSITKKTKPIPISIKEMLENRKMELSDKTSLIEKSTFSFFVAGKLREFNETGSELSNDFIEAIKELQYVKDKKIVIYIQEIIIEKGGIQIKLPDQKFILIK